MHALSAKALLAVWEQGIGLPPFRRALLLLEAACPDEEPAALSIGRRNARLLDLREALFGSALYCLTACPACGESLELNLDSRDFRDESTRGSPPGEVLSLATHGYAVEFRLPNSLDLVALNQGRAPAPLRTELLERCSLSVRQGEQSISVRDLPAEVMVAVAAKMAEADPESQLELELSCPACQHGWLSAFDITSFFWTEIHQWARRLLREIHILASAYGWAEADILAMTPLRRQIYLELVGA